jgi:hypothetical protein
MRKNMFFELESDKKSAQHADKIEKLCKQIEQLDQKIEELLSELNVSEEQLTLFLKEKENFNEEQWEQLTRHTQELKEKLERDLAQIRNPAKLKQAYCSLKIQPHWLFVR